jgi:hypothetical protein
MDREPIIPPFAAAADDSFELLRVWAAGGSQHVTIRSDLNGGASTFGFMLAQLVRHGANLYWEREGRDRQAVLSEIRRSLEEELANPCPSATGSIGDQSPAG